MLLYPESLHQLSEVLLVYQDDISVTAGIFYISALSQQKCNSMRLMLHELVVGLRIAICKLKAYETTSFRGLAARYSMGLSGIGIIYFALAKVVRELFIYIDICSGQPVYLYT